MKNKCNYVCEHEKPGHIITTHNGERVCMCGVVLEEKIPEEHNYLYVQTNMSLYHQLENGGDPNDMKVINRGLHIHASSLSEFSNVCDKLGLPDFVQKNAWATYHKFRSATYFTRAKCALFSIYHACRDASIAVDERQIKEIIQFAMGVKNIPSALNVLYEMRDDALELGIDTNKRHSSTYCLNLAISRKQHLFEDQTDYDRFKIIVMRNFHDLDGNLRIRADRAVNMALCIMGVI